MTEKNPSTPNESCSTGFAGMKKGFLCPQRSQSIAVENIDENDASASSDCGESSVLKRKCTLGDMEQGVATNIVDNPTVSTSCHSEASSTNSKGNSTRQCNANTLIETRDEDDCSTKLDTLGINDDTLREKITKTGDDLLQNERQMGVLLRGEDRPCTFPPVPYHLSFVDRFYRDVDDLNSKEQKEKRQIDEFEAEVEVFRALEDIKTRFVLHGLKYTHEQFTLFVPDHNMDGCKKTRNEEEGECDFIVIGSKYIAVLEVKSPDMNSRNPEKMCYDRYKESLVQRQRTVRLIEGVFDYLKLENRPTVFSLSIFNRLFRENVDKFKKFSEMTHQEKKCILFKDDFLNFEDSWTKIVKYWIPGCDISEKNVPNEEDCLQGAIPLLLGLWCTDKNNETDIKKGSVVWYIQEIDKKLKTETITRKPKGPINREVKGASDVFKKNLGIECLTKKQSEIFKSKEKLLCINGPAGSGKTVLILGKMIQLAKEVTKGGKKLVVITFGQSGLSQYESACKTASIKYISIHLTRAEHGTPPVGLDIDSHHGWEQMLLKIEHILVEESLRYHEVAILYSTSEQCINELFMFSEIVSRLCSDYHLIVDDAQYLFCYNVKGEKEDSIKEFIDILKQRSESKKPEEACTTWLGLDIAQFFYNQYSPSYVEPYRSIFFNLMTDNLKDSMFFLSRNLRNTLEISEFVSYLRQKICASLSHAAESSEYLPGHNIHGFKPIIHILHCDTNGERYTNHSEGELALPEGSFKRIFGTRSSEIDDMTQRLENRNTEGHLSNLPSAEWPACIATLSLKNKSFQGFLTELYILVSRARVYSAVVIGPMFEKKTYILPGVFEFIRELKNSGCATIIVN